MMMNTVFLKLLQAMLLLVLHLQLQLLVSHSWSAVGTEVRCIERERQALLEFKAGLVDDYGLLSSWGSEEEKRDCCQWKRVRCSNQTGHVQMLHLQGEDYHQLKFEGYIPEPTRAFLTGKISTSLMELEHLRYLNLSWNAFENSHILEFFGSLRNLRYLDVSHSCFVGKIPDQLGSLSHLRHLDLRNNVLEGTIPSQLGNLSQLQYLNVGENSLIGAIPYQLGNLSSLEKLYLGNNYRGLKIHKENPADAQWLSDLTSLTVLDLSQVLNLNNSHNWLQMIGKLQNLRELSLVDCDLSDHDLLFLDPSKFNFSSSLTILDLSLNSLTSSIFPRVFNFSSSLVELHLRGLLFEGPIPYDVGNMTNSLETLDLSDSNNNLTARVLKSLGNICTLSTLLLSDTNLSGDLSTVLHNLSGCARYSLQELDLRYNQITGLLSDLSKFQSLKSLDLSSNQLNGIAEGVRLPSQLEGGIPESFWNTCSLNSLDLSYNRLSVELPLMTHYLFGCRSTLQVLNLGGNQITGGLHDISKFSSLKKLYLSGNKLNGTLDGIRFSPQLESLDISGNSIEGGIPESFGKICSLGVLDLSNNSLSGELSMIIHNLFGCARSLQYLNLEENQITGTLPNLKKFSSLKELDVSLNQLNGEIPKDFRFPSQLVSLKIASNSKLKGVITDSHVANMSKLKMLDLSFNSLTLTFSPNWVPSFQLQQIHLRSCTKLGPKFPKWLQTQKNFMYLDISDSRISDMVPEWFWSLSPQLSYLNISHNNMTGTIPNSSIRYTRFHRITLASNQFEGPIPPFLQSAAASLDLSKNKFSSAVMFVCANSTSKTLGILDLSNNQLSGNLPDCWNNFKSLVYLDMSNNNYSGKIPSSMGSLVELQVLILRNNKLSGDLPLSLKNCTELVMLDVGENRFSGTIPSWIGNALKQLMMLSLRINHFSGSIPLDLCHLTSLQFLDLSLNNLSGEIPKCLKNFTAMSQKESPSIEQPFLINYYVVYMNSARVLAGIHYDLNALLMWKGVDQMFKNTAFRLRSIDLSSNHLIGGIPEEITNLVGLVSLNLSRNNLTGKIPSEIGRLTSLEFLDLSRNHFHDKIPSSLAQIDRLTMLDLSHNQLSGRIPTSTQLQSFNASSYEENLDLCGKPLEKECPEEEAPQEPPKLEEVEHSIFSQPFYISMALGFITGFWGIFGSILVNRSWRYAYFRFLNNLTDAIYVMAAVNVAKCRGWLNGLQEKWFPHLYATVHK